MNRRLFLGSVSTGLLSSPLRALKSPDASPLDQFVNQYMQAMNAPGLTLATVTPTLSHVSVFGYSDLERKTPVTPDLLFEIGSITKSFVALTLLKLREEEKLDFEKPVLEYLPWLPIETHYGAINVHHLLTHSSGLPDALSLFLSDPQARHVQAFKPGEHFHYCNLGFCILGHLIQKIERKPWPQAVRSRILEPLGMTSTYAVITDETKSRRARSYVPFFGDRSYSRQGPLAPASELVFENAAGSITSIPGDMARYLQMLLNRGDYDGRRIVSPESFAAFSKPYLPAQEFGPTAAYGYGIGVDKLDGHTILRHTGGMVSFASSLHADLDGGVAAFASINAMQGYRPTPVTQYAVQCMNAQAQSKLTPPPPPGLPVKMIPSVQDYAGLYTSSQGKRLEVVADAGALSLQAGAATISLERSAGDVFIATVPEWSHFPLIFGRSLDTSGAPTKGQVVELAYGAEWYRTANYSGPTDYPEPPEAKALTGFYQSDSSWAGSIRIVIRKGKLWADGTTVLQPIGNALYRVGDDPFGPDSAQFHYIVEGKAQLLKWNGADLWRLAIE